MNTPVTQQGDLEFSADRLNAYLDGQFGAAPLSLERSGDDHSLGT